MGGGLQGNAEKTIKFLWGVSGQGQGGGIQSTDLECDIGTRRPDLELLVNGFGSTEVGKYQRLYPDDWRRLAEAV